MKELGWENFMYAAMTDPKRFSEIMDQFFEVSKRDMMAMAEVPDREYRFLFQIFREVWDKKIKSFRKEVKEVEWPLALFVGIYK